MYTETSSGDILIIVASWFLSKKPLTGRKLPKNLKTLA